MFFYNIIRYPSKVDGRLHELAPTAREKERERESQGLMSRNLPQVFNLNYIHRGKVDFSSRFAYRKFEFYP